MYIVVLTNPTPKSKSHAEVIPRRCLAPKTLWEGSPGGQGEPEEGRKNVRQIVNHADTSKAAQAMQIATQWAGGGAEKCPANHRPRRHE